MFCDEYCATICTGTRIGYSITEGELPESIDPDLYDTPGYKVEVRGADLEYCDTCYTNEGLAEVIDLAGPARIVDAIEDVDDELSIYVELYAR